MNWRRIFPAQPKRGRIIYILSASIFYRPFCYRTTVRLSVLKLNGCVGDFCLAFGKLKSNMKQIWQDFKERWPMAVLGILFVVGAIIINL